MYTQHCDFWCPGAKAPGRLYPQCWLNIWYTRLIPFKILDLLWKKKHTQIKFHFPAWSVEQISNGKSSPVYSWTATITKLTLIARFMGPTWGPSGADRTLVGPMLAPWTLLSGVIYGKDEPSAMTQHFVTVGAKLWTGEWFAYFNPWIQFHKHGARCSFDSLWPCDTIEQHRSRLALIYH